MCGITGIFHPSSNQPVSGALLQAMNQAQFHRGPDEGSVHIEAGLGFGHRRLSIIDIASGQQPLWDIGHRACIVFNGEIYNYKSLREELISLGCQFDTHSDTEVIVQAWLTWGEACVERLRGMFAFAIWDPQQQTLFLARDRLGIKPLYYCQLASGELMFASELKSLLVHPELDRAVNREAIEQYFALGYVPEPDTIYQQVAKLPPAHTLTLSRQHPKPVVRQYWDVSYDPQIHDLKTAQEQLLEQLDEAVRIRLMAEVPLGSFLSGGVDSSAVVASMAGQIDDGVKTCSIGFDSKDFNETDFAQMVADRYQTDHQVEQVASEDFSLVSQLAALYDEPFADSSAIPTYRVCELARKRVTVALSGDGGDEVFAGYRRYRWHMNEEKLRGWLPDGIRKPIFGTLGKIYPKVDWAPKIFRAKSTLQAVGRTSLDAYFNNFAILPDELRSQLYSSDLKGALGGYSAQQVFQQHAAKFNGDHPLSLIQYLDMKTYLPGDILTKVDRASMAHALEVRVPILDHKLVEWAATISPELKLKGQEGKHVFKKALEPRLPNDVLYRPKMGFAVPLAKWFRGALKQQVRDDLLNGHIAQSGWFEMPFITQLVDMHQKGLRDNSASIWTLLMFEAFLARNEQVETVAKESGASYADIACP